MAVDTESKSLVSTDWLEAHLGQPDLRIVDATYYLPMQNKSARAEYDQRHIPGAERTIYGFETITWCPYERALIDTNQLDDGEIAWINDYHAKVWEKLGSLVEGNAKDWLEAACRPL